MTTATTTDFRGTIADLKELRPHLASSLERLDLPEAGSHRHTLGRLLRVMETFPATSQHAMQAGVLANMFRVIARGDAQDYEETALLYRSAGRRIADSQTEFDDLVGVAAGRPYTTAAIIRLSRSEHIRQVLVDAGRGTVEADLIATQCSQTAFWLLMAGVDGTHPAPIPIAPANLQLVVEKRGVGVWRAILANIAANPFGPDAARLADLAYDAGLPSVAQAIEGCTRVYRKRFEEKERLEVAHEIRHLVSISGCSQRRFAKYIGTSAPRLSTYVNGLVTPSASMMLRIRRCASDLAQAAAADNGLKSVG